MAGKFRRKRQQELSNVTWSNLELWLIGRGDVGETDPRNLTGAFTRMIWLHQGTANDRRIGTAVISSGSGIKYDKTSLKRLIGVEVWVGNPDLPNVESSPPYVKELSAKGIDAMGGQTPIEQAINDAKFTDPANLTNLRLEVNGTQEVTITKGTYKRPSDGNIYKFDESNTGFNGHDSIASLIPGSSGQHRIAWVTLARETGKIKVVASSAVSAVGTLPQRSQLIGTIFSTSVTTTYKRIVPIYLYYGQASVAEADVYRQFDARIDDTAGASGGGAIGNVVGPASAVNNDLAAFDGTTGKLLKDSGLLTADVGKAVSALADKFILQTPDTTNLPNAQALSALATGLMQVTTTTGVVSSVTTSAGLAALISDETGSGALVFGLSPTITTPILLVKDSQFTLEDDGDTSKQGVFQLSGISTATTRTLTWPNANGTIALTNATGQGYVMTSPTATADNTIAAATTTIDLLTLQSSDDNTTKRALRVLASGGGELAYITPAGQLGGANLTITGGGYIRPSANSTSALLITKADGTTTIVAVDSTNNTVGIGGAAVSGQVLTIRSSPTSPTSANTEMTAIMSYSSNSDTTTTHSVMNTTLLVDGSGGASTGGAVGWFNDVQIRQTASTWGFVQGINSTVRNTNAGATTRMEGLVTIFQVSGAGAVTNGYDIHVRAASLGGAGGIATHRGIYIENMGSSKTTTAEGIHIDTTVNSTNNIYIMLGTTAPTGSWAIHATTTNDSALAGALQLGATTAPGARLQVNAAASAIGLIVRANATTPGNIVETQNSGGTILSKVDSAGNIGVRMAATALTAYLHIAAGTTAASTAPLKFTTGTSMTTAEAGAMEYTTDDLFFTISTGTARKRLLMADPVGGLTSGRVSFATTNGRLIDDAGLTYATASGLTILQSTLGNVVQTLSSTATNDDPSELVYQDRITTTDNTTTTLHTFTVPASTTYYIHAIVVARRTGGLAGTAEDGATYEFAGTYKNVSGTATLIGAVTAIHTAEDQAAWNATFDVTGATVRARVTGDTNNNVTWHVTARVYQVGT